MAILQPMPLISRGVPAFTNDDFAGSFPAAHANDATYGGTDYWRCAQTPVSNANSGTLIAPVYLAYDLSGVGASQRGQVVVAWYTDVSNGAYRPDLISQNINNLAVAYTIDVNPAAGGTLPTSGWVTKATVTGSTPYHSRQHSIDMTGNNWVRINVTGITGSAANNNVALNMDVHDAHLGVQDDWIFFGDSITQRGFMHDEQGGIGNILPQQINAIRGAYFPLWECGGMGGWTATDLQPSFATFLALFPGKYVALNMGTNDANLGGTFVTNFSSNMTNMVQQILTAGKIPVIPHIPWINTTAQAQTNVTTLNGQIDSIIAANPGTLAGPDLYAFFSTHQSEISSDGIHPTDPALAQGNGYVDYRAQWVNWATANIYLNTLNTDMRTVYKVRAVLNSSVHTAYKVRTILKTLARSTFKVQLSGVGPQPYRILNVTQHSKEHPFSTVRSQAIVTDANGILQNSLVATVTVTYPDNSTTTPQVYWLGNGVYSVTYNTKGVGTLAELWIFTDSQGSQAEYKNPILCNF
jgi:lysophospholipase L1-like esterase